MWGVIFHRRNQQKVLCSWTNNNLVLDYELSSIHVFYHLQYDEYQRVPKMQGFISYHYPDIFDFIKSICAVCRNLTTIGVHSWNVTYLWHVFITHIQPVEHAYSSISVYYSTKVVQEYLFHNMTVYPTSINSNECVLVDLVVFSL